MINAHATATDDAIRLARLRTLLQEMDWRSFERMVPILVGQMIDVRFTLARSGYQDGADAGTVGREGRRLRLEAKRYTSNFDARDVIGGLRQAIARDPALECWIACATRDIPEQLANQLEAEGASEGIPVLTIAWEEEVAPMLAALCTQNPRVVTDHAGEEAGTLAAALEPALANAREALARELETWQIGFEALRARSHAELDAIWHSKRAAKARFGQDVAGGDGRPIVNRLGPSLALDAWWNGRATVDAPAAVTGQGGAGKTWAAIGWMMARIMTLPIIVTIPAGAAPSDCTATTESLLRLIASQLAAITGTRDAAHWVARLKRILARPEGEGPALCLVLDGINQNPGVPWMRMLQILQDRPFSGRVRTILTTRPQHFEATLNRTRSLAEPAEVVAVGPFDDAPGSELDMMLVAYGLKQSDLQPDLVGFARVPRLFGLVIRLRDRFADAGRVTTHRLLWEYGRDVQGERAGASFSEADWRSWLAEIARRERTGMRVYTLASLGETAARSDLDSQQVAARLSDIVDGNLTIAGPAGSFLLVPEIVANALGMALLDQLDEISRLDEMSVEAALAEWLDPIDGLEERAEVLRAATSIMGERQTLPAPEIAAAVMTAWLQTQNLPASHLAEIRRLAPRQVQPLLETVERSDTGPHASARAFAISALRSIPADPVTYGLIVATLARWFSRVSRDLSWHRDRYEGYEQVEAARSERILSRIGIDVSGPCTVLGVAITLEDFPDDELLGAAPTILDGQPLAGATEVFVRAALAMAIRGHQPVWDALKWLCLLNEIDPQQTAARLRQASVEIVARTVEPGVHSDLPARVGALLLWLTGIEDDAEAAHALDPGLDHHWNYETDYLPDPGRSWFRLERRHAEAVLNDHSIALRTRLTRAAEFIIDPTFDPPAAFVAQVREAGRAFDPAHLDVGRFHNQHDHDFEELEVALARCAPDVLADLGRRKLAGYATRPTATFDSSAWSAVETILVADDAAREGCQSLRERSVAAGGGINKSSPSSLLLVEIVGLPAVEQITRVLDANPAFILMDFAAVLRSVSAADVDALLDANRAAPAARIGNLICLLSAADTEGLSDCAWVWLEGHALDPGAESRGCAFDILRTVDAARFGQALLGADWSWIGEAHDLCRHYGSLALAAAGTSLPFEAIAPRVLPALLASIVRSRGSAPSEARLAAAILDEAVMVPRVQPPEPDAELTVKTLDRQEHPMCFSITPGPMAGDDDGPFAAFSQSDEARREHSQRAVDAALARVREARAGGASLFLSTVEPEDLACIIEAAPNMLTRWLNGMDARSSDFARRVRLAEGFFLALCEALLGIDPVKGASLWHALRETMGTRYVGRAGVDESVLMVFRVPRSETVLALRDSLLALATADTDERLLDLAAAAIAHSEESWLAEVEASDAQSPYAWRRRRAMTIASFGTGATLPLASAVLEGSDHTYGDERRAEAARRLARDAAARHWWRRFIAAESAEQALAAWTLFRRSADRRSLAWLANEDWPGEAGDTLSERKVMQVELNKRALIREAEKREKDVGTHLFGKRISNLVAPWYRGGSES